MFPGSWRRIFDEVKKTRPDLSNDSQVAQEGVRGLWEKEVKNEK